MPSWLFTFMKLVCGRLAQDWQQHFGHPVLALETFVDPPRFRVTYFWFFLKANQPLTLAKAEQLLPGDVPPQANSLDKGHGRIENGQPHRRDRTQDEDRCTVRHAKAARNLCRFRSLAIFRLELQRHGKRAQKSLPDFERHNHRRPGTLIRRLTMSG